MAAVESYPDDLKYHEEHDWARIEDGEAVLGVTWFAGDALGELVHFEPPEVGAPVTKDTSDGEVEAVKVVSDVDAPGTGNDDPYGEGWLIRVRLSKPSEVDALLDAAAYTQFLADS